ncbi:MAG: hypothetical protein N2Z65_05995 [Clostridiales bacterium]|nr:hypothetical protein [Clostridiales bacterium]
MREIFFLSFAIFCFIQIYIIIDSLKKKHQFIAISAVAILGFFSFILYLKIRSIIHVPYFIMLLPLIASFLHSFVGDHLNLYNRSKTFDKYLHAFGTFSISLFTYFIIGNITDPGGSKLFRALFIFFLGTGIGSIFEVFEFTMDSLHKTFMQKGLKDTDMDMVFNIIGSAAAAIFAYQIYF